MSCSEVMYQAYYPYLYQRAGAAPPVSAHPVPRAGPFTSPFGAAHQYDRFNVQRLQETSHPLAQSSHHLGEPTTASSMYAHSSTGGSTPSSPLRPQKEEDCSMHGRSSTEDAQQAADDDSSEEGSSRAQYVSANCVVFTHYQGDAASVVDEHFSRALDKTNHAKDTSPMSARNFPASFWNSQHYSGAHGHTAADLYPEHYHPSEAWYPYSQHHRVHDYHHHNMAQYSGLLLPGSRLHMGAQCKAMDWQHPSLDNPYSSYPSMSGLEAQVQDSSKDLYWF
ncbi:vg [Trypoxylus dichotomus]